MGLIFQALTEMGSLLLGLYNSDVDHVGLTSTIANKDRADLTPRSRPRTLDQIEPQATSSALAAGMLKP